MSQSSRESSSVRELRVVESMPPAAVTGSAPRVFIVCRVRLYRDSLASSLSRQSAVAVSGAAGASPSLMSQVQQAAPDVLVLDMEMPGSLELARALSARVSNIKIVGFAVSEAEREVLACAEAGISAYVEADASAEELVAAIQSAMSGELYCSPRVAGLLFRRVAVLTARQPASTEPSALTAREHQILDLVANGLSNKQIARQIGIGNTTVKNHVHNILRKLKVSRRGEAAALRRSDRFLHDSRYGAPPRPARRQLELGTHQAE